MFCLFFANLTRNFWWPCYGNKQSLLQIEVITEQAKISGEEPYNQTNNQTCNTRCYQEKKGEKIISWG